MPDKSGNSHAAPTGPPAKDVARTQANRERRHSSMKMKGTIITAIAAFVGALIGGKALLSGRSGNSQATPTEPPARDVAPIQPYREPQRQKKDKGALIAAGAALAGAVIGGAGTLVGTYIQLGHQDSLRIADLRRVVYQDYLSAQQNLNRRLIWFSPSVPSLNAFLTYAKTWQDAPGAWQKVQTEENRLSLYASNSLYEEALRCDNDYSDLASRAKGRYEDVSEVSKNNPELALTRARIGNQEVRALIEKLGSKCDPVRTQMRAEIGVKP